MKLSLLNQSGRNKQTNEIRRNEKQICLHENTIHLRSFIMNWGRKDQITQ